MKKNILFQKNLFLQGSIRSISSFISAAFILLSAHYLPFSTFASLQINFSLAAIALWIGDFGLMNMMIIAKGMEDTTIYSTAWVARNIGILFVTTLLIVLMDSFHFSHFVFLLFLGSILDLYTDSLVSIRQISTSTKVSFWLQIGKKLSQTILLVTLNSFSKGISVSQFFTIYSLPSALVIGYELINFRNPKVHNLRATLASSFKIWIQNGGTALAGLDLWIISQLGGISVVPFISIGRRCNSVLGNIGTVLSIDFMHKAALTKKINRIDLRRLIYFSAFAYVPIVVACLAAEPILLQVLRLHPNGIQLLVFRCVLLSGPLAIVTSSLNSMLLGLQSFRKAAAATFLSTAIYLPFFLLSGHLATIPIIFIFAWYANNLIEMMVEFVSLRPYIFIKGAI